jgi:hypothetical protein
MKLPILLSFSGINNITLSASILLLLLATACSSPHIHIQNPYETVDWSKAGQYKANLHTHTVRSDGSLNPQVVVDEYHAMGYSILAITDHNEVTYPWTAFSAMGPSNTSLGRLEENPDRYEEPFVFEDRDPSALQMIAIQANEVSSPHHAGSFFSGFKDRFDNEETTFSALQEDSSVVVLFHPGRYTNRNPEKYTDDWYIRQLNNFTNIIGVEIYNQGDRYPTDRALWDRLLTSFMPDKNIWAFSNDDMHGRNALGRNWNVFLLPELTDEAVKEGMKDGLFYYVYAPEGHDGPTPPAITGIDVDERKGTIEIFASDFNEILWISGSDTIQRGIESHLNIKDFQIPSPYVRAELWGAGESITGTQPFGIITHESAH